MYYLWNLKLYLHNKYVFKVSRNGGFFCSASCLLKRLLQLYKV